VLNFLIVVPETSHRLTLHVQNGQKYHQHPLDASRANPITIPFVTGGVRFKVSHWDNGLETEVIRGEGREIVDEPDIYNYNMWTGTWRGGLST
jgi:hypothetical protein